MARGRDRVLAGLLTVTIALAIPVALALVAIRLSRLPGEDMSATRITPAVALLRGFPIYTGPDSGPILDQIYGPVSTLLFLPAGLAGSPSMTLLIGAVINVLVFFLPAAWLHRQRDPLASAAGFLCFVLLVCSDLGLSYSAFTIHCDAAALGLGACACGLLARREGTLDHRRLVGAVACAVLAVWAKQSAVPLLVALALYLMLADGILPVLRYGLWLVAIGSAVSVLFVALFGYRELVFNMFTVLAHHPWYREAEGGKWAAASASLSLLLLANRWPALLFLPVTLLSLPAAGGVRAWVRTNPWLLLVIVGFTMVPTSVVGAAKVGAFLNAHSFTNYFVVVAATTGMAGAAAGSAPRATLARGLLVGVLLFLVGLHLANPYDARALRAAMPRLRAWSDNPQQRAYAFARAHPGEVYFPWNPLASLQAEGRLDHCQIGIWDRAEGGYPPSPAVLDRYLPPHMRWVAFRTPQGGFTIMPLPTRFTAGFTRKVTRPELPGWEVYERDGG